MTTKFKTGDRVRLIDNKGMSAPVGSLGTVGPRGVHNSGYFKTPLVDIIWDDGIYQCHGGYHLSHFELVSAKVSYTDELGGPFSGPYRTREITKTWIIAVLDSKGKPRPSTSPRVYTSEAQAEAVAKKMAAEHMGETFMVLTSTAVAAIPAVPNVELVRL